VSAHPKRAIVLARISDARDGDEHGVQRQVKDALRKADDVEWTVGPGETHVIVENDTSAFNRRKVCSACYQPTRTCPCPPLPDGSKRDTVLRTWRPGFRRALAMLRSGQADGLIAVDLDRACRDPRDLEDLIDVVESRKPRIPVESVSGSLRLANDGDVTMARVMVAVGNKSSRDTGRRVSSARQSRAERGEFGGGIRPFGYEADGMTICEREAEEVRRMADQFLAGMSLRTITLDLRERGVPTVTGAQWGPWSVRDILLKARNAGLAVHQVREKAKAYRDRGEPVPYDCGVIGPAAWPAILPEDTWRAVAARLTDPSRTTTPGNTPRWLGSLIYRCGVCAQQGTDETVSIGNVTNGRGASYMCRGARSGHLRRSAPRVDEYVTEVIIARLSQPDAAALVHRAAQPDKDAVYAELNALKQRKAEVVRLTVDGTFTPAEARAGSEPLNKRISEIEALLAVAAERSPLDDLPLGTGEVAAVWEHLPLGNKRAILRLLMDVTLIKGKPGRYANGAYFDGSSVQITWKR
jgi:DNA invertase Pin-like site-specific DNA recombinase